MVRAEIKIAFLHEVIADAAHDHGVIAVAQFRDENADREGALLAQRAGEKAGLIIEFARGGADAFASFVRDGAAGDVVQDKRNGCRAKAEVVGENFQTGRLAGAGLGFFVLRHALGGAAFAFREGGIILDASQNTAWLPWQHNLPVAIGVRVEVDPAGETYRKRGK